MTEKYLMTFWSAKPTALALVFFTVISVGCTVKKPEDAATDPTTDITLPNPTISAVAPSGPSNNNNPVVSGTSSPMMTILIYSNSSCTTEIGHGLTHSNGSFSITTNVPANATTSFFAKAFDTTGASSACASSSISYVEDSTAPSAPVFASSTPASPANNNAPVIAGTSEASSSVKIYSDVACSTLVTTVTASSGGGFSFIASVVDNTSNNFYATSTDVAGNTSVCSSVFNYVEDSVALAPVFVSSSPASPSNVNTTTISGTAEAGATLRVYSNVSCSTLLGTASVNSSGNFTYSATVADNSTSNFYGAITDVAGNVSACSSPVFTYVEDSIAPSTPSVTSTTPVAPHDSNAPTINGSAEAGATINIYSDAACTTLEGTGTVGAFGTYSASVSVVDNVAKTFYAKAVDAAGNASGCSSTNQSYTAYTIPEGMAWLQGTTTTAAATNTNLNQTTASSLRWTTTSFIHSTYYSHSSVTNPHQLSVKVPGDYLVSIHIPYTSTTAGASVRAEVRVNGVAIEHGRVENGFISAAGGHNESSLSAKVFLPGLISDDKIEVTVIRAGTAGTVTVSGRASINVEKIETAKNIFSAKATQTVASTNLNGATASGLSWSNEVRDANYGHSNSTNPERITLSAGTYLLAVNVPFTSTTAYSNVQLQVKKNGVLINGGKASQGLIRGTNGHNNSSAHWFGILTGILSSDVITVETIQEADTTATVTVPAGLKASLYIEEIPSTALYVSGGNTLVTNSNWNNSTTAQLVRWTLDSLLDTNYFTHSTSTNPNRVNITTAGTYQVYYRNSVAGSAANLNASNRLKSNGAFVTGAEAKSNYVSNISSNNEASTQLNFLLRDVAASTYLEVDSFREAGAGTVSSSGDAQFVIIHKPLSLTP